MGPRALPHLSQQLACLAATGQTGLSEGSKARKAGRLALPFCILKAPMSGYMDQSCCTGIKADLEETAGQDRAAGFRENQGKQNETGSQL